MTKKMAQKVILAGIPGEFWQLHEYIEGSKRAGDIIEEFRYKREAVRYAKKHKLKIIKIESHKK